MEDTKQMENEQEKENSKYYEEQSNFFLQVCSYFLGVVNKLINDDKDVVISVWFDYDNLKFYLRAKNENNTYDLLMPDFPKSHLLSHVAAYMCASAQRIIDVIVEEFKKNIEIQKTNYNLNFNVEIGDTCVYKELMYWRSYNIYDENNKYIFFHPYFKEKHTKEYEKILKREMECGYVERDYTEFISLTTTKQT